MKCENHRVADTLCVHCDIAWCERCGRKIRKGRPYVIGSKPGLFMHRGPCLFAPSRTGGAA